MKVCIVGTVNMPIPRVEYGGIEEVILRASIELAKMGCDIHILTVGSNKNLESKIIKGVNIHEISRVSLPTADMSTRALKRLMFGHRVSQAVDNLGGFDVIHLNVGYSGWEIVLRKQRVPVVFTVHNSYPWLASWSSILTLNYFERVYLNMNDTLTQFVAKRVNRVLPVSSHMGEAVIRKGVDPKRVKVIFNSVDSERFYPILNAKKYFIEKYSIPSDKVLFLFLGGLRIEKGIDYLLRAFQELSKYYNNVFLLIAGKGHQRDYLETLAKSLKIDNIKFLGSVCEHDLPIVYSACDVYVLPSILEPGALTLLEALASGKPIIITRDLGKDFIEDGKQGFLVPTRDWRKIFEAMVNCMDATVRKKMGVEALERSKSFTWKEHAKQLLKTYNELI